MKNKKMKILSIDGGGIKGLYSLYLLKKIEEEFRISVHEYFDMFCGTSTGGIIALGLASGKNVDEMIDFYEKNGKKIFPYKKTFKLNSFKSYLFKAKYTSIPLKDALQEVFNEKKIGDLSKLVCVPTVKLIDDKPVVIKNTNSFDLRDKNFKLVDVSLATSAAPIFFPIAHLDELGSVVDGGLFANNPTFIGVIEALEFYVGKNKKYESMDVLSLGNIPEERKNISKKMGLFFGYDKNSCSLLDWNTRLIDAVMVSQVEEVKFILNFFKKNPIYNIDNYIRLEELSVPKTKIVLDDASDEALKSMKILAAGRLDIFEKDNLKIFFE